MAVHVDIVPRSVRYAPLMGATGYNRLQVLHQMLQTGALRAAGSTISITGAQHGNPPNHQNAPGLAVNAAHLADTCASGITGAHPYSMVLQVINHEVNFPAEYSSRHPIARL